MLWSFDALELPWSLTVVADTQPFVSVVVRGAPGPTLPMVARRPALCSSTLDPIALGAPPHEDPL